MFQNVIQVFETAFGRFFYAAPLCFLAGALASLSMAPLNAWFVLPISFATLYACLTLAKTKKASFFFGWCFGFGYFVFSLSWIGNALLVEGNDYKWAWPLAVSGLPALLAFFTGFAALFSTMLFRLKTLTGFLGFVGIFSVFEWLRGHLFTGFPWNLFGYTWADTQEVLQILFWTDAYFLSLLTLFWCGSFGALIFLENKKRVLLLSAVAISFLACFGYGTYRLNDTSNSVHENVQIKIIQPNIAQSEKWQRDKMMGHLAQMIEQSRATDQDTTKTYIVWPETALSYWFLRDPGLKGALREMLYSYPKGAVLFAGLLDRNQNGYSNSLVMIDASGKIINQYNKSHLVPFGEYIPFQEYIPLKPVAQFTGFEKGDGVITQTTPDGLKYTPLICYEILFPHKSIFEGNRPDFILNVTNDAWYGISAGPYQHLTKALYRAIETGVPVIRAANTGISTVISPYGSMMNQTSLFENAENIYKLPLASTISPFSSYTKTIIFFLITGAFLVAGLTSKRTNINLN